MCVFVCVCVCAFVCAWYPYHAHTTHLEVMDCYSIPNGVGKVGGGFYWRAGKVL